MFNIKFKFMAKRDIKEVPETEMKVFLAERGEKPFRYKQIQEWLFTKKIFSFNDMKNIPAALRGGLEAEYSLNVPQIQYSQLASDGTRKLGLLLHDGVLTEAVLIPSRSRVTACISTQVGCRMGCRFCATARLGFNRNLSAGEIFDQVAISHKECRTHYAREKLSNVVIMGMGEPFDNYDALAQALKWMQDETKMGMSPQRITVSTVGFPAKICQFAREFPRFNLSVSLHMANQKEREQLIPTARKYPLNVLAESLQYYHQETNNRITYEYVMLKNVNDKKRHAMQLAEFAKISPCKVNLIEYNSAPGLDYEVSDKKTITDFMAFLESKNMVVNLRRSRGADIDAACGQLANRHANKNGEKPGEIQNF